MQRGTVRHPVVVLLLTWFTCGLYFIYWYFVTCDEINRGLGEQRLNAVLDFVLGIVTCGLWFLWWHWQAAEAIVDLEKSWGVQPKMDAPIIFVCAFFGIGEMVMQIGLNNAWENGMPGGGHRYLESEQPPGSAYGTTGNQQHPMNQQPPTDGW